MKPVQLAQIGLGAWGKNIEKTLRSLPECTLAYTATEHWRELLEKNDIDGVVIATPPASHAEIAVAFLERGIPVFIEKPMTASLQDALLVESAAKKSGALVMVGHINLYNPAYQKAKELLPEAGALRMLISRGHNWGPYRADYSAMWDWAPHDISMMLDLLRTTPERVSAWGVAPSRPGTKLWDYSHIKLDFPGGVTGSITSSWLMPQKCKQLTIVGEKKSIVFEDTLPEKKVALYQGAEATYPEYEAKMPLTEELAAFVRMVSVKEKPQSDLALGLSVVRILDAAERSIARGGISMTL